MNNAPEYIKDIVKNLRIASSREEMYQVLNNAVNVNYDFICDGLTCFNNNEYRFQCTLKIYADRLDIEKINLESHLTVLEIIPIENSDMCVIFSKIKKSISSN